ncbi:hypothetical protein PPACK8108_LOCUS3005 [Phakopsora pachyrhizi]|uniref:Uncharacterized protein n=1 Tax=Phakopsora pachyrhizi TaxID=170000 RepID=A0AAV0ALU8_PHAPC|nr:hypothetical protein PPACK8108_LOCUS3005 [Phakopsora pachyrhizi]
MQAVKECPESVKQNCPADRILDRSLKVCQSEPLLVGDWRMLLKQDGKALICIKEWSRYWIGWTGANLFKKSQSQVRMMSYESIKGEETDKEEDNYEGIIEETDTCFESAQNHSILAHHLTASMVVPIDPGLLGLGPKVFEAG